MRYGSLFLSVLVNEPHSSQGRIPVKWTAPEALKDHIFSFKSDMLVDYYSTYIKMLLYGLPILDITTAGLSVLFCGRYSPMVSVTGIAINFIILSNLTILFIVRSAPIS